jgi:hypothetical protein
MTKKRAGMTNGSNTLINNFDHNKRYKKIIKEGVRGVLSYFL